MKKAYTHLGLFWLAVFACWCSYSANTTLPVRLAPEKVGGFPPTMLFLLVAGAMVLGYLAGTEHDDNP